MLISLQNEYHSRFMFTDYGFKSMRDMAYKLPSVFYVKMVEERDECILYSTCRRVELESDIKGWCGFTETRVIYVFIYKHHIFRF